MRLTDLTLTVLASARLTRFVITDSMGKWWIKDPIDEAMDGYAREATEYALRTGTDVHEPWWWKYREGLDCAYCAGFWIGAGVLATHAATARRPRLRRAWRFAAGAFALNYAAAHLGSALGDFDHANDDRIDAKDAR